MEDALTERQKMDKMTAVSEVLKMINKELKTEKDPDLLEKYRELKENFEGGRNYFYRENVDIALDRIIRGQGAGSVEIGDHRSGWHQAMYKGGERFEFRVEITRINKLRGEA